MVDYSAMFLGVLNFSQTPKNTYTSRGVKQFRFLWEEFLLMTSCSPNQLILWCGGNTRGFCSTNLVVKIDLRCPQKIAATIPCQKTTSPFSMPFIHILIMSDLCLTILCWGTYVPVCSLSWSLRKQTTSFASLLPWCDDRSSFWWNSKTPSWGRSPKFLSAKKHQTFRKVTKTWPAKPWMSRNFIVLLVGMVDQTIQNTTKQKQSANHLQPLNQARFI